jgi:hypothetical protein
MLMLDEPDKGMRILQRSAMGLESALFLHMSLGGPRQKLSAFAMKFAVLTRIGFPIIGARKSEEKCCLCEMVCGSSAAHALSCSAPGLGAARTMRHSLVQGELTSSLRSSHFPDYTVFPGAPEYIDYFLPRDHATTSSRIKKADILVAVKDRNYLLDVNVSGVTTTLSLDEAMTSCGALAKHGETRKRNEVVANYVVPDPDLNRAAPVFVPFVVDVMGSFGECARGFLKAAVDSAPVPTDADDLLGDEDDVGAMLIRKHGAATFRSRLLWRINESISAAVHRKNATILHNYLCKMRAAAASM